MLSLLTVLSATLESKAEVWKTERQWSLQAESEFSQFIRTVPMNIFNDSNTPWARFPTDCADAVYALRIVFAYQNKLPVQFQNSKRYSNLTSDFDSIQDPVKRVRKFIARVTTDLDTKDLSQDTYPVQINRQWVRPGTLFLHAQTRGTAEEMARVPITYRSGHVYYLQEVYDNGMIKYISSTVPTEIRNLNPRLGITFAPQERDSGYRVWKWADSADRPGFSEEQFQFARWRPKAYGDDVLWTNWQEAIQSRLRTRIPTPEELLSASVLNLTSSLKERAQAVLVGWNFYLNSRYQGQGCMSDSDYDDHSTPTRDVKIQNVLYDLEEAVSKYLQLRKRTARRMSFQNDREVREIFSQYSVEVYPGTRMNFAQVWNTFMTEIVLEVSEPEHSPAVRWGLTRQGTWVCPYRKKQYKGGEN